MEAKTLGGGLFTSEALVEGITTFNGLGSSRELFLERYGHFLGCPKV